MTQAEKTEAVIAMIDRTATELGETEAPLIAHARELARKLDAVKDIAKPGEINVATARDVDFAVWKIKSDIDDAIRAILARP